MAANSAGRPTTAPAARRTWRAKGENDWISVVSIGLRDGSLAGGTAPRAMVAGGRRHRPALPELPFGRGRSGLAGSLVSAKRFHLGIREGRDRSGGGSGVGRAEWPTTSKP